MPISGKAASLRHCVSSLKGYDPKGIFVMPMRRAKPPTQKYFCMFLGGLRVVKEYVFNEAEILWTRPLCIDDYSGVMHKVYECRRL